MDPISNLDLTAGRYLLAVRILSEPAGDRVSTGQLSAHLDVSAASVTEMIGKLHGRGLLDHEKYRGVELTDTGEQIARRLAWRFCVVTNFFGNVLEMNLNEHESYNIGRTLPKDGIDRLREFVDHPCVEVCPEFGRDWEDCLI